MKKYLLLFLSGCWLLVAAPAVAQQHKPEAASFPNGEGMKNAKLSYKIIVSLHNTWGYDIYNDGKLMIHQPTPPGMPGNDGFKTKAAAKKIAELVMSKIKKGEMPPTVTMEEMKKLKAI